MVDEDRKTCEVDMESLAEVLAALNGPGYLIRELLVIHGMAPELRNDTTTDPIGILLRDYHRAVHVQQDRKPEDGSESSKGN